MRRFHPRRETRRNESFCRRGFFFFRIPAKSGARELIQDCKAERKEREDAFANSLKELGATFERTLDRFEGRKPADPPRGKGQGLNE